MESREFFLIDVLRGGFWNVDTLMLSGQTFMSMLRHIYSTRLNHSQLDCLLVTFETGKLGHYFLGVSTTLLPMWVFSGHFSMLLLVFI